MPLQLSFNQLQALCVALNQFPPAHPHRWACIDAAVARVAETGTDDLKVGLPSSRDGSNKNFIAQLKRWESYLTIHGVSNIDGIAATLCCVDKSIGSVPYVMEPEVSTCLQCGSALLTVATKNRMPRSCFIYGVPGQGTVVGTLLQR